jgi:hypothetical protein
MHFHEKLHVILDLYSMYYNQSIEMMMLVQKKDKVIPTPN